MGFKKLFYLGSASLFLLPGCVSDYSFSAASPAASGSGADTGNYSGTNGSGSGSGSSGLPGSGSYPTTTIAVQQLKPTLAIRGINCLLCHGNIGANIVTDFGHNSDSNGLQEIDDPTMYMWGASRTAYNDVEFGSPTGGWELGSVYANVYVPSEPLSASIANNFFGVNSSITYSQGMALSSTTNTLGSTTSLPPTPMDVIVKSAGNAVTPLSGIHIGYPTQSEIVALVSGASLSQAPAADALSGGSISGLVASSASTFMRNGPASAPGAISCTGDVVVIGPLFLKNATINTNDQGCRLYVTGVAAIQGQLTVQGSTNANLQISSAKAVIMGFDLLHLGYAYGTNGSNLRSTVPNSSAALPLPDSTSFFRFSQEDDPTYYPTNAPSGYASNTAFFDSIVEDAVLIDGGHQTPGTTGPSNWVDGELVDAYSATEPSSAYVSADPGYRLAYDYSHVLFNAPQIHSRYGGSVSGVMVGDVALFILTGDVNTTNGLGMNFSYDSAFDNATILPQFPSVFTASP
jgi:hypothetical protein